MLNLRKQYNTERSVWRWIYTIFPSIIVTVPFLGTAFQGDQRLWTYVVMNQTDGGNPLGMVHRVLAQIDFFLSQGNFRPLGRLLIDFEHVFYMKAGLVTGVPPHLVHGFTRLILLACFVIVASRFLAALERSVATTNNSASAGFYSTDSTAISIIFPITLASTLVIAGLHPLVYFPVWHIGAITIALAITLVVGSDKALSQDLHKTNSTRSHETILLLTLVLLGGLLAMIYDLLYLAPAMSAALIIARATLARIHWRKLIRSVAAARLLALSIGFLIVFGPTRLMIADRCKTIPCALNSDINISGFSPSTVLNRMLTGFPTAGWHEGRIKGSESVPFWTDMFGGLGHDVVLIAVALMTAYALYIVFRNREVVVDRDRDLRLGLCVISVGLVFVILPSLMVSLSPSVQYTLPTDSIGHPWRDTLLVQIGWSVIITGILLIAVSWWRSPNMVRSITVVILLTLAWGVSMTYDVNHDYAQLLRGRTSDSAMNLISTSMVNFSDTKAGRDARCGMVDTLGKRSASLVNVVNEVAEHLHDEAFCSDYIPPEFRGIFADDDDNLYEEEIEIFVAAGITSGCGVYFGQPDEIRYFCPEEHVSHAAMAVFIRRMEVLGLVREGSVDTFVAGYSEFGHDLLRRMDATVYLVDIAMDRSPVPNPAGVFTDIGDIYDASYAEAAYRLGFDACDIDGPSYCPMDAITRDELAQLIVHIFDLEVVGGR